jgi:predicted RNA binding protein YcfA (HicA-like mRNA interferase family)
MKLPRDLSARELIQVLARRGYVVTRQRGSHIRLTTQVNGEHHITIPDTEALRAGTLGSILRDVAEHFGISRQDLIDELFGGDER